MSGVVLENLSTKKLIAITFMLLLLLIASFIMGGIKVPASTHHQVATANLCLDKEQQYGRTDKWFYPHIDGSTKDKCRTIPNLDKEFTQNITSSDIVFSFQYPLPRSDQKLNMSKMFMYHVAVLTFSIVLDMKYKRNDSLPLLLEVRVGGKSGDGDWSELFSRNVTRYLTCLAPETEGHHYTCDVVDLFEIGNMFYQKYLVNIKIPPNPTTGDNMGIGRLGYIDLVWFAQTGGFTVYFLVMKTVFFALILPFLIWYWKRVNDLNRPTVFMERMLIVLGVSTIVLNFPVDWLVLAVDIPFMLLWSDIRQGFFLAVLLSYWLVFTGEHLVDDVKRGEWKTYMKHLSLVILASLLMFLFDMCERGIKMVNPLYSLWATPTGSTFGKVFIGISIAAGLLYFIVLLVFVVRALVNIWKKRRLFPKLTKDARIHYMSIIYRFNFMLVYTLICCAFTISAFIVGQVYESEWKWRPFGNATEHEHLEDDESVDDGVITVQVQTAMQLGVYATWNVYVLSMLIFYAPSHKPPVSVSIEDEDETDGTTEMTTLTRRNVTFSQQSSEQTEETTMLTSETSVSAATEGLSKIYTLAQKIGHD